MCAHILFTLKIFFYILYVLINHELTTNKFEWFFKILNYWDNPTFYWYKITIDISH